MAASQQNSSKIFGRFDPIHIALAVTSIIFLILSIVFIILFATKHDTSTGFLATGFSNSKHDDVQNELNGLLKNKYTVNSFALDTQNSAVSAVFSLRGSVSTSDVQKVLSGSKLVTQLETTYGDKATAVCRQPQVFAPTSTQSTLSTSPTTAGPTDAPTSTQPAPVDARYCKNTAVTRDIILVVDFDDLARIDHTEKMASLQKTRGNLLHGLNFPQVNVYLKAVIGGKIQDISTAFATTSDQFNKDFDTLFAITTFTKTTSLNFAAVLANGVASFKNGRAFVPGAIFVLTDKPISQDVPTTDPRSLGIFVGVSGVNKNYISKQYAPFADMATPYDTWTALSDDDPFRSLVCSFYSIPATQMNARFSHSIAELDDVTNSPKCQVLDIIIAFDTSESLSRIILPKYVDFAKKLVAQYKYKDDDFTRVGIITFNSAVTEKLTLTAGNSLDAVNAAINSVQYTGGLTDVTSALKAANKLFTTESSAARSKVLIVLSDAVPTVDTYQDEIDAGQQLAKAGVATFFVGYSSYSDDVKKELGQVTKPEYVFGDMSDASFTGITTQILATYPCPLPKCVTAYYAIEISEATDDYVVQNLKDIVAIATKAGTQQSDTASYQLATYNEGNTQFFPKGDSSLAAFLGFVNNLIKTPADIANLRGGNTRLDTAITDVANELANQAKKNTRFSGNIIFFGQANDAVLDPNVNTDAKKALLATAATNLRAQTQLIFVVDDSRPADLFGADLWTSVTNQERIIAKSDNTEAALELTDYFTTWTKLSCSLPALLTCYDTQLDVAVMLDLQNKDYDFINYITTILSRFSSADDAHFSMFAYGSRPTTVLSNLAAHSADDIQNYAVVYEDWRNGSYFTSTVPQTTTTPLPTTVVTTVVTSTVATSTKKAADFWTNNLYTVDKNTISGVFDAVSTQFGCGHYNDNGDRRFAPNLLIFASDNFASYTDAVWQDFQTELHNRYGCWDCAATPTFLFLSRTADIAPAHIGPTIVLSNTDFDIDATDDTSTQANINKFNNIVNSVCIAPLPQCSSYTCFAA